MATYDTGGQRRITKIIQHMGHHVEMEKHFPPYTADMYLQEFHVIVEYDGSHHSFKKRDAKRDKVMMEKYGIPTLRLTCMTEEKVVPLVKKFIEQWKDTVGERKPSW